MTVNNIKGDIYGRITVLEQADQDFREIIEKNLREWRDDMDDDFIELD